MTSTRVIVGTCKAYGEILELWYRAARKFWPDVAASAIFCTDEVPVSSTFSNSRFFANRTGWCQRLIECLEDYEGELVILLLDDYILEAPVRQTQINKLSETMYNDPTLGVIYLTDIGLQSSSTERVGLFEITKGPYSVNSCPGLWRRAFLIETLKQFNDPWAWEAFAFGTRAASNMRIACWAPSVYKYSFETGGLIYRGQISQNALARIEAAGILASNPLNLESFELEQVGSAKKRPLSWKIEFLKSGMNVSIFTLARFIFFALNKNYFNKKT